MSKRRYVGDVVLLHDEEEGPYLGRIDALGAEPRNECDRRFLDPAHDQNCREWPNVEILDAEGRPTGQWGYHVCE